MRLIIFAIFLSMAFAKPQPVSEDAVIVSYESESDPSGGYTLSYQTSDSQTREEQGVIKNADTNNEALSVNGSYTADEIRKGNPVAYEFFIPDKKINVFLSRIASERSKTHTK